jgi:thioredoxin reductase
MSEKYMKVIIVGGVAGGASAAARLRRLNEQAEIILLERGEYISYANCGLPYYVGGAITDREELTLQTPESFHARFRVDVRVRSEAMSIDPANKTVTVKNHADGSEYTESYDDLILSPGAEPVVPPIPGIKDPRVFTLRTIPDTFRIRDYIEQKHPKSAVVVGGGAIGMEMAENLREAGLQVTIVELMDHVIAPLDSDMAAEVHNYARKNGLRILLNTGVKSIAPEEGSLTVEAGEEKLKMVTPCVRITISGPEAESLPSVTSMTNSFRHMRKPGEELLNNGIYRWLLQDGIADLGKIPVDWGTGLPLPGITEEELRNLLKNSCEVWSDGWISILTRLPKISLLPFTPGMKSVKAVGWYLVKMIRTGPI